MTASPLNESCVLKDCDVCLRSNPAAAGPLYARNPSDNMRQKHTHRQACTQIKIHAYTPCDAGTEINLPKDTQTHCVHTHTHNRFMALFPGPPGWASATTELLDFMAQRKINGGRHTDHPARLHSIWTNQCPPPPSPIFYRPDALPATQPTVSKHWR